MIENLGIKKYALPVGVILVIFCVFSVMMYPLLHAEPKNVPLAIVNLDEGITTPGGELNLGNQMMAQLQNASPGEEASPFAFTVVATKEALDQDMANNKYYGALIIPADFSAKQWPAMQATMPLPGGTGENQGGTPPPAPSQDPTQQPSDPGATPTPGTEPTETPAPTDPTPGVDPTADPTTGTSNPTPEDPNQGAGPNEGPSLPPLSEDSPVMGVIINSGKNPMIGQTLETGLPTMLMAKGLNADISLINNKNLGTGFGAMMSGNVIVMPIFMMSAICAVLLGLILRPKKETGVGGRLGLYAGQLGYAAILSALISAAAVGILTLAGGLSVPLVPLSIFLAIGSFCVMTLFLGALDIARPLGILVILTCFACGMSVGMLAKEMLPDFWQSWIYPWAPQRPIGQGAASILYMGGGPMNSSTIRLIITGAIGLVLMILASLLGAKKKVALGVDEDSATPLAKVEADTLVQPFVQVETPQEVDLTTEISDELPGALEAPQE
jgi:hypothetical protein